MTAAKQSDDPAVAPHLNPDDVAANARNVPTNRSHNTMLKLKRTLRPSSSSVFWEVRVGRPHTPLKSMGRNFMSAGRGEQSDQGEVRDYEAR